MWSATRRVAWLVGLAALACGEPPGVEQGSQPLGTVSFCDGQSPVPSYSGTIDTEILSETPAESSDGGLILHITGGARPRRALLRWDLSSLAAQGTVRAAQIALTSTDATSDEVAAYALRRPWAELAASWNVAGPTAWESPGADGPTDRNDVALAAIGPAPSGRYTIPLNDAGVDEVNAWVRSPDSNFGLVIIDAAGTDELVIASREEVVTSRPCLIVAIDPPDGGTESSHPERFRVSCESVQGSSTVPVPLVLIALGMGIRAVSGSRRHRGRSPES